MKFDIFRPNAFINSQSLNNTQVTNSFNKLSHWYLHKVQENEKRKNMNRSIGSRRIKYIMFGVLKINYQKTRWNRHVASNSYITFRDEISTSPAGIDFTLRLHEEINFHPGKAGQVSRYLLAKTHRFPLIWKCLQNDEIL